MIYLPPSERAPSCLERYGCAFECVGCGVHLRADGSPRGPWERAQCTCDVEPTP